jgi:hypothetical protein
LKQIVKKKVEELSKAILKEDFGKVVDLTHPSVVKPVGGREKMIAILVSGNKEMKAAGGLTLHSIKVNDASDPVTAGPDTFVVVPFLMEIKAPGEKHLVKSFVIGVSSDQGKSWVFVNGDLDLKTIKRVVPNLPEQLKLPEKQKPVIEKD